MKIAIIGGDKRMLFAARAFADDGHEVNLAGFDHLMSLCSIHICGWREAIERSEIVVLPVVPVIDGSLNTPYSEENIPVVELTEQIGSKPVYTGCSGRLAPCTAEKVYDYSVEEVFTLRNAQLTAEGALGILLSEYEGAVCGAPVLVTGYGRIGKYLSAYLHAMYADVTVAARKESDRDAIVQSGMKAADYPVTGLSRYAVIINTVPAMILGADSVDAMRDDVFLIDLASKPGGVDFARAKDRGLTCMHALSLPGRTAPLTAGCIIKDTILTMLSRP